MTPIVLELAIWSDKYLRESHPTLTNDEAIDFLRSDKVGFANMLITNDKEKLATTKN